MMFEKTPLKVKSHKKSYDLNKPTILEIVDSANSASKKTCGKCFFGQRHVATLVGFLSCFLLNANRLVLSVGIVAMVKHGQIKVSSNRNESEVSCPMPSDYPKLLDGSNFQSEFDWSTELQGYLLGAGSLSYLITQIPAGGIADSVGSKSLLVFSNAVSGILTLISPFAARWHIYALIAVHFLRGASQGFTTPAMYKLTSNWIPRHERGTLSTLVVCGYGVGAAVSGIVTGWLCEIPGFGWPSAFYVWGIISVVVSVIFQFLYYEYPENHPWITDEELNYISDGLEINKSTKNGVISCLPVLGKSVGGVFASIISYWISKKNLISLNKLRKITTVFGAFGFSLSIMGILLAGCDAIINIICFALSLFCTGIALSGIVISGVDMAPAFAGSLMGVASTVAGSSFFIIPVITGLVTTHETLSEWRIVFWINLAVVGSSGLVYVLFGSAEVQPWNYPESEHPPEVTTEESREAGKKVSQEVEMNVKL